MDECPLCCNPLDHVEREASLCSNPNCKYQLCFFCYKGIFEQADKDLSQPRCPNCREVYDSTKIKLPQVPSGRKAAVAIKKKDTRRKKVDLMDVRVIQRNLVYAVGLASELCSGQILKGPQYFGKYGKIRKISVSMNRPCGNSRKRSTGAAYIVYNSNEDALKCIYAADGQMWSGQAIRTCYGTTKYCHAFLKGVPCGNPDCLYLHEISDSADCITKEDMHPVHGRKEILQLINPGCMARNNSLAKAHSARDLEQTSSGPCDLLGGPDGSISGSDALESVPAVDADGPGRFWHTPSPSCESVTDFVGAMTESAWPSLDEAAAGADPADMAAASTGAPSNALRSQWPSAKDIVAGKAEPPMHASKDDGTAGAKLVSLVPPGRARPITKSPPPQLSQDGELPLPPGLGPPPGLGGPSALGLDSAGNKALESTASDMHPAQGAANNVEVPDDWEMASTVEPMPPPGMLPHPAPAADTTAPAASDATPFDGHAPPTLVNAPAGPPLEQESTAVNSEASRCGAPAAVNGAKLGDTGDNWFSSEAPINSGRRVKSRFAFAHEQPAAGPQHSEAAGLQGLQDSVSRASMDAAAPALEAQRSMPAKAFADAYPAAALASRAASEMNVPALASWQTGDAQHPQQQHPSTADNSPREAGVPPHSVLAQLLNSIPQLQASSAPRGAARFSNGNGSSPRLDVGANAALMRAMQMHQGSLRSLGMSQALTLDLLRSLSSEAQHGGGTAPARQPSADPFLPSTMQQSSQPFLHLPVDGNKGAYQQLHRRNAGQHGQPYGTTRGLAGDPLPQSLGNYHVAPAQHLRQQHYSTAASNVPLTSAGFSNYHMNGTRGSSVPSAAPSMAQRHGHPGAPSTMPPVSNYEAVLASARLGMNNGGGGRGVVNHRASAVASQAPEAVLRALGNDMQRGQAPSGWNEHAWLQQSMPDVQGGSYMLQQGAGWRPTFERR